MNAVQLNKRVIFLVIGYPGAGKSYFSRQFAEVIGAHQISEDRIRYELFSQPNFGRSEEAVIERIRDYMLEEVIKTNRPVIIDANLNKAARKRIADRFKNTETKVITIWIQTDLETSFGRASARDRRQMDDKYNVSMSFEVFDKLQRQFTKPDREEAIVLSGKHLFKTQLVSVFRRLASEGLVQKLSAPNQAPVTPQVPIKPATGRVDPNLRRLPLR